MAEQTLTEVASNTPAAPDEVAKDYMKDLVGEGKKYKTNQELAKGYVHVNLFAEELKAELTEARKTDELLSEVLTELRTPKDDAENPAPATDATAAPANSPEDIANLVRTEYGKIKDTELARENTQKTIELLIEAYPDKETALNVVKQLGSEDEGNKKVIDFLGATNPESARDFIVGKKPPTSLNPPPNAPSAGTGESAGIVIPSSNEMTWAKCQKIRKDDPRTYASDAFRKSMEEAVGKAMADGKDFFATTT